jgi:hypothetical protein
MTTSRIRRGEKECWPPPEDAVFREGWKDLMQRHVVNEVARQKADERSTFITDAPSGEPACQPEIHM